MWKVVNLNTLNFVRNFAHFIYCLGILNNGADEFEDSEEIYEAIGEVLHEISEGKTEKEIR